MDRAAEFPYEPILCVFVTSQLEAIPARFSVRVVQIPEKPFKCGRQPVFGFAVASIDDV
jgi:hypothetical protein